ncbi:MAG: hypothetical protein ABI852_03940 [Gemmatimonadaceae bacterium]
MPSFENRLDSPRLSAATFAEFARATEPRRKRIVLDAMDHSALKRARYDAAERGLQRAILAGGDLASRLRAEADTIRSTRATTDWQQNNRDNSAAALHALAGLTSALKLQELIVSPGPLNSAKIRIRGVLVSVRSQLILRRSHSSSDVGCMLLVFRKTGYIGRPELVVPSGAMLAELVRLSADHHSSFGQRVDPALCIAVDVFGGQMFHAKKPTKRLTAEIDAVCDTVAMTWAHLRQAQAA